MKWKEDMNKDNQGPEEARNNGRDPTENQSDSVQEEENTRQQEGETGVVTTRRSRKKPVTRSDDFLWTTINKKWAR